MLNEQSIDNVSTKKKDIFDGRSERSFLPRGRYSVGADANGKRRPFSPAVRFSRSRFDDVVNKTYDL